MTTPVTGSGLLGIVLPGTTGARVFAGLLTITLILLMVLLPAASNARTNNLFGPLTAAVESQDTGP